MTDVRRSVKNGKRGRNRKDGATGRRQPRQDWEAHGFIPCGWNKHSYSFGEGLPSFMVQPGIVGFKAGLVAHCGQTEILFPYGTPPAKIAEQLNDIIYDDLTADPEEIDWAEWEAQGLALDFDGWMTVMERSEAGA